jgi:tetratricopeptide (TPR) repeat protein
MPVGPELRWLSLAFGAAFHIWDDEGFDVLSDRYLRRAREVGALSELPLALFARIYALLFAGELSAAAALTEEMRAALEATGTNLAPYGALGLAAMRGSAPEASGLIEAALRDAPPRGEGLAISAAEWASALLNNGLGSYTEGLAAAQRASENHPELGYANWALVELIEAAARSGETEAAAHADRRLAEMTSVSGTDWGLGVQARSRALLSEAEEAERLYREAIERLSRTHPRRVGPRSPAVRGVAAPGAPPRRGARSAAHRAPHARGHGHGGIRRAGPPRARGRRRDRPQAHHRHQARADRPGGPDRPAGPRRPVEPGDQHPAVPVPAHRPVPLGKAFTKLDITSRSQLRRLLPATADTALPR